MPRQVTTRDTSSDLVSMTAAEAASARPRWRRPGPRRSPRPACADPSAFPTCTKLCTLDCDRSRDLSSPPPPSAFASRARSCSHPLYAYHEPHLDRARLRERQLAGPGAVRVPPDCAAVTNLAGRMRHAAPTDTCRCAGCASQASRGTVRLLATERPASARVPRECRHAHPRPRRSLAGLVRSCDRQAYTAQRVRCSSSP